MAHPFIEALAPYRLPSGIVGMHDDNGKLGPGDNPYLRTSTAIFLCRKMGIPCDDLVASLDTYFRKNLALSTSWIPAPETEWSDNKGGLSHDEVNGIMCSSEFQAKYLHGYARDNNWVFRQEGTRKELLRAWYWRMMYLVPALRAIADEPVPALEQQLYRMKLWQTTRARYQEPGIDTSGRCLILLHSQWVHKFPTVMQQGMDRFLRKTAEQFGDIGGLYRVYYGANHPFTVFASGIPFKGERRVLT